MQAKRDYPVNENIQSYRQDNPIWGDDKIGKSSFTLASSGCVITCISSMLSLTDHVMNPQELNSYLTEHGVFDDEGNLQWGILDAIEGFHAEVFNEVSSDIIDKCLAEGKLPIIKVHQNNLMSYHHFILVIGAKDGEYICMDPLQDHLTKLSEYKNKVFSIRCVSYNG
ncbi:MAG: hypothetical protein K6G63_07885 [Eubacterium sp.]|nr:hypothetical protein [Eubacterium sp.]